MTYFGVLALFVGPPLVVLALLAAWDARCAAPRHAMVGAWGAIALVGHVLIALLYTTPWDNYLVATGVWWYDPELVTGITLGYVPIEEYTFFVVQTLLTGLWLLALMRFLLPDPGADIRFRPGLRRNLVLALVPVWLASAAILLAGWEPGTYLGLTLVWALPPIMLQLAYGADILWSRRRLVAVAILVPSTYLWLADAVAIQSGTWTIDPAQSTGILAAGVLPIEEVVFFTLTNVLVVFGMTLLLSQASTVRSRALRETWREGIRPPASTPPARR